MAVKWRLIDTLTTVRASFSSNFEALGEAVFVKDWLTLIALHSLFIVSDLKADRAWEALCYFSARLSHIIHSDTLPNYLRLFHFRFFLILVSLAFKQEEGTSKSAFDLLESWTGLIFWIAHWNEFVYVLLVSRHSLYYLSFKILSTLKFSALYLKINLWTSNQNQHEKTQINLTI